MNQSNKNKLVLITGASSGIGAATAQKLASEGMRVILVARRKDKLTALVEQINSRGGIAYCYASDLSMSENCILLANTIKTELGIPDVLINNAGIGWYGYFSQMPWQITQEMLSLNIEAATHLTSLLLPEMQKLNRGHIIFVGSIMGKMPEQGVAVYSASKAYLDAFSKSIYRDLRGTPLSISILRAGPVKTNFFDNAAAYENGGRIPAENIAISPDKIAEKVLSLINHPRRFIYVPFYTIVTPLLETFFSWLLDIIGPILLRKTQKA
jgi:short-subunit dehydrogenase